MPIQLPELSTVILHRGDGVENYVNYPCADNRVMITESGDSYDGFTTCAYDAGSDSAVTTPKEDWTQCALGSSNSPRLYIKPHLQIVSCFPCQVQRVNRPLTFGEWLTSTLPGRLVSYPSRSSFD